MTKEKKKQVNKSVVVIVALFVLIIGIGIGITVTRLAEMQKTSDDNKTVNSTDEDFKASDCVKLGDYMGLNVSIAVSQDDIDSEIDSLLEDYTTYKQKSGTVKDGDKVYASFEGYINGKKKDDTCGSDYIDIGSGDWLEGFEEALIGVKTGESVTFTIKVPEGTYGDDSIDGHKVKFTANVEYICGKKIVPTYNDDFVKSISTKYDTTDEYDAYIKKKLLKENETDKAEYAWTDVLDICSATKYPQDMMASAEETVLQGYYDMADIYGCTVDEVFDSFGYGSEDEFKKNDLKEMAQDTVKENLVAQAIAEKEGISYTDDEYQSVVEEEYAYNTDDYGTQEDYEKDKRQELQDETLLNAVKSWLGENLNFTTEEE